MLNTARFVPRSATCALAALCVLTLATGRPVAAKPKAAMTDWPANPNTATSGSFSVMQLSTANAAQFMAEWNKPTPSVRLHGTMEIRHNQPIATFIAFRGCRADKAGKCNVTATFDLCDPSGKVTGYPEVDIWANRPRPPPRRIMISRQSLGMTFNTDDAVGSYTVRAAVTDHVAGVTLHTQQDITVSN